MRRTGRCLCTEFGQAPGEAGPPARHQGNHRGRRVYRRACALRRTTCWRNNLATLLQELGQIDAAVTELRACLTLAADDVTSLVNLAAAYQALGRFDEAVDVSRCACEIAARNVCQDDELRLAAEVRLASLLMDMGRHAEVIALLCGTVQRSPDAARAWYQLGRGQLGMGQPQAARADFDAALRLAPHDANVHLDRALLNIQYGPLAEGWDEYEWRWAAQRRRPRTIGLPRWNGESIESKTILVHGEQGVGDEVMFATCVPDLVAVAGRVIVSCDPRLVPLLARSLPEVTVRGHEPGSGDWSEVAGEADVQVPAGSLPRYFRRTWEAFPTRRRFLQSDPAKQVRWRRCLTALGNGLKVGIAWRAGSCPADEPLRWAPLAHWHDLLATPGVTWVSLQHGQVSEELAAAMTTGAVVHDLPDCDPLADLDNYAALLDSLDLVISVGNATVHLAGALGRPVWALLPQHWGWRWFAGRDNSPWYPSVRLFRQQSDGSGWPGVLRAVQSALAERLNQRAVLAATS
ncbi:MAG: tetratricopeptide repeat protein [Pirellulales bacterium]